MAAPLTPHWTQPSHPRIQKVLTTSTSTTEFSTKSISLIDLPPFALFAKLDFPPCTKTREATYATVQMGREEHLMLNSDLVYINHSCEPSVIFDTSHPAHRSVLAGPNGLKAGEELTFFYPSTEWSMAQGFECHCKTASCRGYISGAKDMTPEQLEGLYLNAHIRELLEERDTAKDTRIGVNGGVNGTQISSEKATKTNGVNGNGGVEKKLGETVRLADTALDAAKKAEKACQEAIRLAEISVEAQKKALHEYRNGNGSAKEEEMGAARENGVGSRELSGEMGGDTVVS